MKIRSRHVMRLQEALLETHFCGILLPHLAHTCAGTVAVASSGFAILVAGVEWPSVLATLLEGATVEGVEALSPISFHISSAACVRLHQHVMIRLPLQLNIGCVR